MDRPSLPPGISALPRFALIEDPSPLQQLRRFSATLGDTADVWIKREDLLPLAFGGNKLRNLEFLVGAALADAADTLVTSGRRWSNHCRLTAAAGARAGLDVHLVVSGPPEAAETSPNVRLDTLLGATVHVATTEAREARESLLEAVVANLRADGRRPFVIQVGGSGAIGAAGQVVAGMEVAGQARVAGFEPETIVLPSATGGTQAGVLTGLRIAGSRARVLGIAVGAPSVELRPAIASALLGLTELTEIPIDSDEIDLTDEALGPGYGHRTPAATEATTLLARTEGILVDPIYTAKALAGLIARIRDGRLGGPVIFWHAGGTPGLFEVLPGGEGG